MFNFFKKKPITEENVEWTPPETSLPALDELALCRSCQFAGRCQYRDGCKMYKQTVENRHAQVEAVRGFKGKVYHPGELRLNYMTGIGWRDRQDKYHFSQMRIVHIDGDIATVEVKFFEDGKRPDRGDSKEFSIRIPTITSTTGYITVDMFKFRQEMKQQLAKM